MDVKGILVSSNLPKNRFLPYSTMDKIKKIKALYLLNTHN
jgi:hypothetical protein